MLKSTRADWRLRSFTTAGVEVSGASHNALGAWLWLAELGKLGALDQPRTFHQELGADVLPIVLERIGGRIHGRMRQSPLRLLPPLTDVAPLAAALGLTVEDVLMNPAPRPANTGATHLLVRVRDASTVDRATRLTKRFCRYCAKLATKVATFMRTTRKLPTQPTHASSIQRWACGKTPQPAPPLDRSRPISGEKTYCAMPGSSSSKA